MKIVLYSKCIFVGLEILHNEPKYERDAFTNELRKEISNKSEFGNSILKQLNQENGKLNKETQKRIWKQILNKPRNCEFLLIKFFYFKEVFELFLESLNDLGLKCEMVLNFFIETETLKAKAKNYSQKFNTDESFSEDNFVERIMSREEIRLNALKEISDSIKILNLNSDCSEDEMEIKMLNEIKNKNWI
jgi:adenylate kinase family enzyme